MSVTCSYAMKLGCAETLATGVDAASSPTLKLTGFDSTGSLSATSTVPVTKLAFDTIALVAGAKTIDLTNTVGVLSTTVDFTGLKVQLMKIKNRTGNSVMTFSQGSSNPYTLAGSSWSIRLKAGQEFMLFGNDIGEDVAAGVKNIDIAGTGTESFDFIIVAG